MHSPWLKGVDGIQTLQQTTAYFKVITVHDTAATTAQRSQWYGNSAAMTEGVFELLPYPTLCFGRSVLI